MTFLVFAGSILVLVGIHEAGHFLVARAFGVYIKEFAIGFGPVLFSFRGKETRYSLRLIPFGGYIKMAGEDRVETDSAIPADRVLYQKPSYARALISIAGPAANLLFAFLITLVVIWAVTFPVLQVAEVIPGTPASEALRFGDRVLAIDGKRILIRDQITSAVNASAGQTLTVTVERAGERIDILIQPEYVSEEERFVLGAYFYLAAPTNEIVSVAPESPLAERDVRAGDRIVAVDGQATQTLVAIEVAMEEASQSETIALTVQRGDAQWVIELPTQGEPALELLASTQFADLGVVRRHAGIANGLGLAADQFVGYIQALAEVIRSVFAGQVQAGEVFQGPVGVAQVLGQGIRVGASFFFQLLGFLSLNFGLINLVPFPALDGSRAAFAIYEWIRRKPISPQREGLIHAIGFLILLGLMILITYRDIARLFQ